MPYKVIVDFKDLQDGEYQYKKGDTYPREGTETTLGRCVELSSAANRRGIPLIEEVVEETETEEEAEVEKKEKRKRRRNR